MSLSLKNISKSFGDKSIFKNFSYDFPEVGLFLIFGKSGIGKTTLLRIISGLDKDYAGEIISGGKENVSYLFQEHRLFPTLSALDNVLLAAYKDATEKNKKEALDTLLSLGFTVEETNLLPFELSGGMKQRVSLARAILKKAPILLLDEPTKELDESLRLRVYSIIRDESLKRLVILVSHNDNDVEALNPTVINL